MWSQYDENLGNNPFLKEIQNGHSDIIEKVSQENWIICVPRAGTFESHNIHMETILDHILVPGIDQNYDTLTKKQIIVNNKHISIDSSQLFTSKIEILFEETFYVEKTSKYTVWCIDRPLFSKYNYTEAHNTIVLESLHDCIDFLWVENVGHDLLDSIKQVTETFLQQYEEFETESLQTQKELVGNLYSQCLQVSLKSEVIKEKCTKSAQFLDNLKVSVETYMQYCLRRKLIFSVNTLQYQTDSFVNKIVRNSNHVQVHDLNVPDKFLDVISSAKYELTKLNNYVTVLDKILCLKRTFCTIHETVNDVCLTADELLQILVFLILKLNINNWTANLIFMREFRLSLLDNSDQNSFVITSLEAAIEFIKSNKFLEIKNSSLKSAVYFNSSQVSVQSIFDQIRLGQIKALKKNLESRSSTDSKLCHPLCTCDKCETVINTCDDMLVINSIKRNEKGQNLLIIASLLGNCDVIEYLLEEKFDLDFTDYGGRTGLHYAASRGYQDVLLYLINSGANVNLVDNNKNTPLHLACKNGHENCVKALIYSSGEVELNIGNSFGETPLHLATKWGYLEIVKILLENGASVIVRNRRNQTVVDMAPNYHVLKLLQEFGMQKSATIAKCTKRTDSVNSSVNSEEKLIADDCKEYGIRPKNSEEVKKIDLLLKAIESNDLPLTCFHLGFSSNSSVIEQKTTCHPLCNCENCENEQDFEDDSPSKSSHNISINSCNAGGYTPLHVAAKFGRTDILRLLLDCGALLNIRTYKSLYTPLHLACIYQQIQVVKVLLKCGSCDIDAQDAKGNTPLFYSCAKNDMKIVEILLCNGANCNKKNYTGRSALQESEENKQYTMFKLLKSSLERDSCPSIVGGGELF